MIKSKVVTVCTNRRIAPEKPSCGMRGGEEIANILEKAIADQNLPLRLERFKCLGNCEQGPNIKLSPGGEFYSGMSIDKLPQLLAKIRKFSQEP